MRRRIMLSAAVAPIMLTAAGCAAHASPRHPDARLSPRRLQIRHAASGARFSGTYHDGRGLDPAALADLSLVLADSQTGAVRPFDPSVIEILWEVGQRARVTGEFIVFSGYRTPETNAAVCGAGNSQHLRAGALDVCAPSRQLTDLSAAALALGRGGVGVYAQRGFIHLDSGPVRSWGDVSPPSVKPRAAEDPLSRIAEAWKATRQW
jgi:uncharacterized protein YcbK (DUF882 family)